MDREQDNVSGPPERTNMSGDNPSATGDGFLSTLSELESRITAIKTLHEQGMRREAELAARERDLIQREALAGAQMQAAAQQCRDLAEFQSRMESQAEAFRREQEGRVAEAARSDEAIKQQQEALAAARASTEKELAGRTVALAEREADVASRAQAADLQARELAETRAQLKAASEDARREHEGRASELAKRASELDRAKATLARDRSTLESQFAAKDRDIVQREAAALAQIQSAEERTRELAEFRQRMKARADEAEQEHEARTAELQRRAEQLQKQRDAFEQSSEAAEVALTARAKELTRAQSKAAAALEQAERQCRDLAEFQRTVAAQMEAAHAEHATRMAELQSRAEEVELRAADAEEQHKSLAGAQIKAEAEIARCRLEREELDRTRREAEAERAAREEEIKRREEEVHEREIDSKAQHDQLERERAGVAEQARTLAEQGKSRDAEADAAIWNNRVESIQLQLGEANAARARLETELSQSKVEHDRLTRELIESNQRRGVPADEAERLQKELAAAKELLEHAEEAARTMVPAEIAKRNEAVIVELRRELAGAQSTAAEEAKREIEKRESTISELREQLESRSQSETPSDELLRRDEAIVLLKRRLDEAEQECKGLRSGAPTTEGEPPMVQASADRRERLRRYKALLSAQGRKIMAAQAALQRRHADCEAVLVHRARLSELAHTMARAEKRLSSRSARTGAAAMILYVVVTGCVLAVMSWEVAKRAWPGTYIARAVIEADTGRRTPGAPELGAWQKDQETLLTDPRLMEVAAERMQRRGLVTVGTPAELTDRLRQDMYVQSAKPGSLTIELRGEGAERTALVLDTLVTSYKAVADQARDERSNDIGVTIAQAAQAGADPLMDKRLERAGGVFGGAALAAGLAGLVIWSRLTRAKRKFDQAAAVEAALDEVDWTALEASVRKHSPSRDKARSSGDRPGEASAA